MERAKNLRKHLTDAEARLWSHLRAQQLGVKFRRQHPIDGYIVDFACVERKLIIELDGGQHLEQQKYDEHRTAALESLGFRVLRFWNHDALERTDDMLESIVHALAQPTPPHRSPFNLTVTQKSHRDMGVGEFPRLRRGRGRKAAPATNARRAADKSPRPQAHQAQPGGEGWVRGGAIPKRRRLVLL